MRPNETAFPNMNEHPDYLSAQSKEWCQQLASLTGKYEYTWNFHHEGLVAEKILEKELESHLHGKVLDVGCGHGEFTNKWASFADEVIGYDMTEGFVTTANNYKKPNVRYVIGRTHDGLPFPNDYFDVAYTKKGPTSWYQEGNRVVRPGGNLILFHPVDGNGKGSELGEYFPGLFPPPSNGTPVIDMIMERLAKSGLIDIQFRHLQETVWIPSPEDVLAMKCFGQSEKYTQYVREMCLDKIITNFEQHAKGKGIKITNFYYLIQARATDTKKM
ncbi:class I SAM-dependent methyltransferase [Lederbergia wuyishanensis]|uniref:23S rRNA (Guanine745-N1)-methyltransferase n=1 Tax=Lederbergia wuyishanensis TaxID=1347903 RepID=A0ABU0D082_9BACI|nr:class I SAM-dependent methyltransferase [Lederbergia wuyishanensis]MCJ8006433.1 methyltransferase domain-containing protein [Lederbergia wuyishanensis]MDQ0341808.1 23S rRNA (guanine745-N1)-methyltransferase [Lederbergia wuyishanensis]